MNPPSNSLPRWRPWLVRLIGIGLLILLLVRLDLSQAARILSAALPLPLLFAAVLLLPLIAIKTLRWLGYLGAEVQWRNFSHGLRVYFGGLFVGFVTPGRLGEFARAYFVRHHTGGSIPRALLTVLVDRLFDLAVLCLVGGLALLSLPVASVYLRALGWLLVTAAGLLPAMIEMAARGKLGPLRVLAGSTPLAGLAERGFSGLEALPAGRWLPATLLTLVAYGVFFGQGLLLARSLSLGLGFAAVAQCLALASLAALLPISISGLGTREWVVTLYLGTQGLQPERALAFSALVFLMFNLVGGLLGGLAWLTLSDRPRLQEVHWASNRPFAGARGDDG